MEWKRKRESSFICRSRGTKGFHLWTRNRELDGRVVGQESHRTSRVEDSQTSLNRSEKRGRSDTDSLYMGRKIDVVWTWGAVSETR